MHALAVFNQVVHCFLQRSGQQHAASQCRLGSSDFSVWVSHEWTFGPKYSFALFLACQFCYTINGWHPTNLKHPGTILYVDGEGDISQSFPIRIVSACFSSSFATTLARTSFDTFCPTIGTIHSPRHILNTGSFEGGSSNWPRFPQFLGCEFPGVSLKQTWCLTTHQAWVARAHVPKLETPETNSFTSFRDDLSYQSIQIDFCTLW